MTEYKGFKTLTQERNKLIDEIVVSTCIMITTRIEEAVLKNETHVTITKSRTYRIPEAIQEEVASRVTEIFRKEDTSVSFTFTNDADVIVAVHLPQQDTGA